MVPVWLLFLHLKEDEDDRSEISDDCSLDETLNDLEFSSSFDMWVAIAVLVGLLLGIGFGLFFG